MSFNDHEPVLEDRTEYVFDLANRRTVEGTLQTSFVNIPAADFSEFLRVVIIIGILAAIAIPTFLGQKQRGYDADAETIARTAATAAVTYSTAHNGSYTGMTATNLHDIEPKLPDPAAAGYPAPYSTYTVTPNQAGDDFTVTVKHSKGSTTYTANSNGLVPPA